MTLQEFTTWANGKKLAKYNDGQYPGQCVSLINQYCWRVLNVPAASWGNAKDWGFNATTLRYFDKVASKQVGDILVYPGTASNPYGHIEIFIGNGQALQQNRFLDGTTHISPVWSKAPIAILRSKTAPKEEPVETQAPVFNATYYLQVNPDVAKAGVDPAKHWLSNGMKEGRNSAPNFHVVEYVNLYPDIKKAYGTNYQAAVQHYFLAGIGEGRFGTKAAYDADAAQNARIATLLKENTSLKSEQDTATNKVQELSSENADLKAQLAVQSEDTTNLNSLGTALQWFIKRLGLK